MDRFARTIGLFAAHLAEGFEVVSIILGWPMFTFVMGSLPSTFLAGSLPAVDVWTALAVSFGLMVVTIEARGLSRVIEQFGLKLGLFTAALSLAIACLPLVRADLLDTGPYIATALTSLLIAAIAGKRHPQQVTQLIFSARRFANGARKSERPWHFLHCIGIPLVPLIACLLAALGAYEPATVAGSLAGYAAITQAVFNPGHHYSFEPPMWLQSEIMWLVLIVIALGALYVSFRRLGSGHEERGFHLWFLACAELGMACASVYCIVSLGKYDDVGLRLLSVIGAGVLAAIVFAAGVKRRKLIHAFGNHNPMFGA